MSGIDVDIDVSDLVKFAAKMAAAPARAEPKIERILDESAERAAANSRANAMADAVDPRPWLGTEEGVKIRKGRLYRDIYSPLDPRGESVGYRRQYGTSVMAAKPFLVHEVAKEQRVVNAKTAAVLVKELL